MQKILKVSERSLCDFTPSVSVCLINQEAEDALASQYFLFLSLSFCMCVRHGDDDDFDDSVGGG